MATLGSLIQPNEQSYFFALSGPAPPAPGQPLQSPVAVIPDGTGNTTLALAATGIAGASAVSVTGSAGVPGGPGNVIVGGFGTVYRMGVETNAGVLQIGLNSVADPVIQYDSQVTHQLLLGDKSAIAGASVQTNVPFVVRDYANDPTVANGLGLEVTNATQSTITNGCATGGTLQFGSSAVSLANLTIADAGANTAEVVVGGNSGIGIRLQGGVGSAPGSIYGNVGASGSIQIGSSAISQDNIVMTDNGVANSGRTVITNLAPPSLANNICSINAQQASIPVGVNTITLPAGVTATDGLWYFGVNVTGGGNEQFQASTIVYYNGSTWSTGGSTQSAQDGNGKYVQLYPAGANMTISFNGAVAVAGYVVITPLFLAPIVGFG